MGWYGRRPAADAVQYQSACDPTQPKSRTQNPRPGTLRRQCLERVVPNFPSTHHTPEGYNPLDQTQSEGRQPRYARRGWWGMHEAVSCACTVSEVGSEALCSHAALLQPLPPAAIVQCSSSCRSSSSCKCKGIASQCLRYHEKILNKSTDVFPKQQCTLF